MKLSVIIPTRNQSQKLKLCLAHLAETVDADIPFEVLVIDNASTDETKTVAVAFAAGRPHFRYYYCAAPGLMAARHLGAEKAEGEILCYLDDDSLVGKEWLAGMAESFASPEIVIAGGPCRPRHESRPPEWLEFFWRETKEGRVCDLLSLLDYGDSFKRIEPSNIFGCNFAVRKEAFLHYGGTMPDYFPKGLDRFIGDGESGLALRIQRDGRLAVYNPRAAIEHYIPDSRLTEEYFLWRRYYNGIHASFREIRDRHGLGGRTSSVAAARLARFGRRLLYQARRPVAFLRRRLAGEAIGKSVTSPAAVEPAAVSALKEKMAASRKAGYDFHQAAFCDDSSLREWVLRPNYVGANAILPTTALRPGL